MEPNSILIGARFFHYCAGKYKFANLLTNLVILETPSPSRGWEGGGSNTAGYQNEKNGIYTSQMLKFGGYHAHTLSPIRGKLASKLHVQLFLCANATVYLDRLTVSLSYKNMQI